MCEVNYMKMDINNAENDKAAQPNIRFISKFVVWKYLHKI